MFNMVIKRTFDGYMTEIKTIYEQLEKILKRKIHAAPDKWDRLFAVDFFIKIKDKYIGLQIKPRGGSQIPQIIKEKNIQKDTHKKFTDKYGGKVFYVYSIKKNGKKQIHNKYVIEDIFSEIERLENL